MDVHGNKTGGRVKGTKNRQTRSIEETLARLKCDPIQGMATIAAGELKCNVCKGKLKTKYKMPDGQLGERTCESCYGTGWEKISPDLRGKMHAELAKYVYPQRKAIEHSGPGGGPIVMSAAETIRAKRFGRKQES